MILLNTGSTGYYKNGMEIFYEEKDYTIFKGSGGFGILVSYITSTTIQGDIKDGYIKELRKQEVS